MHLSGAGEAGEAEEVFLYTHFTLRYVMLCYVALYVMVTPSNPLTDNQIRIRTLDRRILCCGIFRREAIPVHLGWMRVAVRPVGRTNSTLSQAHRRQTIQMQHVRQRIFQVRSPAAAPEETQPQVAPWMKDAFGRTGGLDEPMPEWNFWRVWFRRYRNAAHGGR